MSREKYAALFREGVFLRVYVFSNKEALDRKVSRDGVRQLNLGLVRFKSRKSSNKILESFLSTYPFHLFPEEIFEDDGEGHVAYALEVEPVIIQGFVNYFSRDINHGFRLWPF